MDLLIALPVLVAAFIVTAFFLSLDGMIAAWRRVKQAVRRVIYFWR